jgi:4-hydroxybenzoate polyprenyltransferase
LESIVALVRQSPFNLLSIFGWLLAGRAAFKARVADRASFSADNLPYREPLLEYLRDARKSGRKIILATASHKTVADKVAEHLGIFDSVLATDGSNNLKGVNKLDAIRKNVGDGFVYAGDSKADLPIWRSSTAAILAGVSPSLARSVETVTPIESAFPASGWRLSTWIRAVRVNQWLKNALVFVPLLTAFSFLELREISQAVVAFFAFSFVASATYIVNDLWDLDNDRAHPRKKHRPLASAEISIVSALLVAAVMLMLGLGLAISVSGQFLGMVLLYLASTSAYSVILKRYVLVDVIMLSLLYTLRILAGSVAIGVSTSAWLLAFSVFLFMSLALVKRCAELVAVQEAGGHATRGRDYRVHDLVVLWPLGAGTAVSAIVVFGLFISAPETIARYQSPVLLWLVALCLMYWLSRLWIKTARGEMHDDPIVFAVSDRNSRIVSLLMISAMIMARYLEMGLAL